jgi:3-hydroxyisobutyrate dehydrogenase/2-hydroxy-3-oxopropionate reductase
MLVGGEDAVLESARPVLEYFGKTIIHCGKVGQGTRLKLVVNLLLGGMLAAFAEALVLGRKLGLSLPDMLRAIEAGALNSPTFKVKGAMIQAGDYTKAFSVGLLAKDLGLAMNAARQAEMPLPLTERARDLFDDTQRSGLGDEDIAAAVKFLAAITKVEL